MKFSQYNSLLYVSDEKSLLYNAMTDKFLALTGNNNSLFKTAAISPATIKDVNPELFGQLCENGFMVEDSTDETALVENLIETIDNSDDFFQLHINPTLDCTCRCWYCYETHLKGSRMGPTTIEAAKRFIENTMSGNPDLKSFDLSFFGGEPLMYFNSVARPIISSAIALSGKYGIGLHIHFTTNGYLLNDEILEFLSQTDVSYQITLDGNREQHNRTRFLPNGKGTFDRITSNITKALARGHRIVLRINYTASIVDSLKDIMRLVECIGSESRKYLRIDFQRVWQDPKGSDEEEETLREKISAYASYAKRLGIGASTRACMDAVRSSCYGNRRNYALINYNGDVFSCTARDFTEANRAGVLSENGNIEWTGDSIENRMKARFRNSACHKCRIAPLCGGACRQRCIEEPDNLTECYHRYSDKDIDNIIYDRFGYMFLNT